MAIIGGMILLMIMVTQGINRMDFPTSYKGVGPFNKEAIEHEKSKGCRITALCFFAWAILFAIDMVILA